MGTPEFAVPALEAVVVAKHQVSLVMSQPDRPKGRGRKLLPPPVKVKALDLGLRVWQPETLKNDACAEHLCSFDFDIGIVVAYGLLLPKPLLTIPRYGFINIHPSLLPKYRGPSPLQYALAEGDDVTGMSIMQVEPRMDVGRVYCQTKVPIDFKENMGDLHDRMAVLGAENLCRVLECFDRDGKCDSVAQNDEDATYCYKVDAAFCRIDWSWNTEKIVNQIRSLSPFPGAQAMWKGVPLKILKAHKQGSQVKDAQAGTIVAHHKNQAIEVATVDGSLWINELKIQGSRAMTAQDFVNGQGAQSVGTQLE